MISRMSSIYESITLLSARNIKGGSNHHEKGTLNLFTFCDVISRGSIGRTRGDTEANRGSRKHGEFIK